MHTWSSHARVRNTNSDEFKHFLFNVAIFWLAADDERDSTVLSYKQRGFYKKIENLRINHEFVYKIDAVLSIFQFMHICKCVTANIELS